MKMRRVVVLTLVLTLTPSESYNALSSTAPRQWTNAARECSRARSSHFACSALGLRQAAALQQTQQQQQQEEKQQWQQQQQQTPSPRPQWLDGSGLAQAVATFLSVLALLAGDVRSAVAENELAQLASQKSTAELVKPECFAQSCKPEVEACAADGDCMKGLLCTAKCMGDAQCAVGCFARYNDKTLEKVLQCTIEDAGCIQIATQLPGPDSPFDAPKPPKALVKATPASMQGKWYKVLGFNPNYDCFECQRNSFAQGGEAQRMLGKEVALDIGPSTAAVEVEYAMPRERLGMPPQTFHASLLEKLEFDTDPGSVRTAHTEGRMFGLTFWENWYVIGQNQPKEQDFRFVYYTGKTLQNRYEGAFVYARKPELPQAAMPSIYKIAREAGLDPTRACCIDNSCFQAPIDAISSPAPTAQPPPFTPVASADVLAPIDVPAALASGSPSMLDSLASPLVTAARDVAELLEDPHPPATALFSRQRPMSEVREYDANGYKQPSARYSMQ
mmetsp:Transcript_75335/g.149549  ORF Transcript_75335/g.149549 Transcript_75335/m.149549 type:complete len:503 (-) Transcript_75335:310-1818(-)